MSQLNEAGMYMLIKNYDRLADWGQYCSLFGGKPLHTVHEHKGVHTDLAQEFRVNILLGEKKSCL